MTRTILADAVSFENMSGAEWPSIKWPIQVYSRDHNYTQADGWFVPEIEDRGISEELHSDEQSADRFSFTATCAHEQQYKAAASAPRLVVELG